MSRDAVQPDARDAFWVWLSRRLRKATSHVALVGSHPFFTSAAVEDELRRLRDAGRIACTNGRWFER
jgi:hypothetical protein